MCNSKSNYFINHSLRVTELLYGIMAPDTPEEIKGRLRKWFKSKASEEKKYVALEPFFAQLEENLYPDESDYAHIQRIHSILGFPETEEYTQAQPQTIERRLVVRHLRTGLRVAALLIPAILLAGGIYFRFTRNDSPVLPMVAVETVTGTQKHLLLPDSSEVWLNQSSTLKYSEDFTTDRTVELSGEAFFSVKKIEGSIFTVKTRQLTLTVLGTQFNVQAYTNNPNIEIELESGEIDVAVGKHRYDMTTLDKLVFNKKEEIVLLDNNDSSKRESDGTLWRNGLDIENASPRDVLVAISNYFNMEIEITGKLPDDSITFGFNHEVTPETVLSTLKNTLNYFSYEISGNVIKITS